MLQESHAIRLYFPISHIDQKAHCTFLRCFVWLQALVVFKSEEDVDRACERDKDFFAPEKFGQRYVRVMVTPDYKPEDVKGPDNGPVHKTVRVKRQPTAATSKLQVDTTIKIGGLPAGVTLPEVAQLFWGFPLKPAAMHVVQPLDHTKQIEVRFRKVSINPCSWLLAESHLVF